MNLKKNNKLEKFLLGTVLLFSINPVSADNLVDVYRLGVDNDPQLKAADASRQALLEAKPQSRALLRPAIVFSATTARDREEIKESTFFTPGTTYSTDNGYSLSLIQPLFRKDYFVQLRQADATVGVADADYSSAGQELILRVAERYFDILAALDSLEFARAEKNAIERQLEQTKQRFEVGLIAITDVHESQAAYDLAIAQEIEAQNQLSSNQEALREITNQLHPELSGLTARMPLITPDPSNIDQWSETALQQNFQLMAAEFRVTLARQDIRLQRSGHLPTLDINVNHTYSDVGGGSFGSTETEDSSIGLQFNLPIYQGGATSSRVRAAQHRLEEAREDAMRQRRAIIRQTRDAYLSTLAALKRVKALKQAVVSAQSALDATEAGLEVGTRTTVDVLAARRELFRAQRDHSRTRYDYILNTLRLKQAAGILTVADLEQVNSWLE